MAPRETPTGVQAAGTSASTSTAGSSLDELQTESERSSQRTSTTTLPTTGATTDLITATPTNRLPTSIEWGPAITASSLPATQEVTAVPKPHHQANGGLSHGAKTTLIATTTIGGTLILAFLIYALWRRRKGATYTEIIHFRPHSSATILLSPAPRYPNFTALPIYRESRYSVRSSKRGSWLSFTKLRQKVAPSPTAASFPRGEPMLHAHWKSANPPTPTRTGHPLSQVRSASGTHLQRPEMAHARSTSTQTTRIQIKRTMSDSDTLKSDYTVAAREVQSSSGEEATQTPPDSPDTTKEPEYDGRWSWTNSQAPPTPRIRTRSPTRRPSRASTGSLPSFKRVQAWIKPHGERAAIPEERSGKSVKARLPPLKNKASKPVLAPIEPPRPSRRLSKKPMLSPIRAGRARNGTVSTAGESSPGLSLPLQRN